MRTGVDSPMESRLRMLLVLAGLPEPEVNVILRSPEGDWFMRFDLCLRQLKLIIEYDGRQHADSPAQWKRDSRRREVLDQMGWRLIVIHAEGIYDNPKETLDRICEVMRDLGAKNLRRRYNSEWTRHFPSRSTDPMATGDRKHAAS